MPSVTVTCHPDGCPPIEAAKAYYKYKDHGMTPDEIVAEGEVLNLSGNIAGRKALYAAIRRVESMESGEFVPKTKYANCGRKAALTDKEKQDIIAFVKKWRAKYFCTCHYIRNELGLAVTPRTVNNVLNDAGFYWRLVPRIQGLTKEQLEIELRNIFLEEMVL